MVISGWQCEFAEFVFLVSFAGALSVGGYILKPVMSACYYWTYTNTPTVDSYFLATFR